MTLTATIAACIAAIASIVVIVITVSQAKRRRLVEIADLVDSIRAAAEWGSGAMLKRQEAQRQLGLRLGRLNLPRTRKLADSVLNSEETVELARSAYDEVKGRLERGRKFR